MMKAVQKADGTTYEPDGQGKVNLEHPSVISLPIAPEQVTRFERRGTDLVLVLEEGREILVEAFFTTYPDDGRNDLVLEDGAEVFWWGQYEHPWTEFHFTEVEWIDALPLFPWHSGTGLLAGGAALGLLAAAAPGSGDSDDRPLEFPSQRHVVAEDQAAHGEIRNSHGPADGLAYALGTPPAHGSVTIKEDGSYIYTPERGYSGPDSFVIMVTDSKGRTAVSIVELEITPVNDPPTSEDAQHTVAEDGSVSGQIDADDADGEALTYSIDEQPENGSVVLNPDGSYTYTPDPDYHGTDSFTVLVDDGNGGTTASTITITVTPEDDPVTAHDDSFSTPEDTPLTLDLLANDVAPDGGLALVSIAGVTLTPGTAQQIQITGDGTSAGPVIGTIDIDANGKLVLSPAQDYNGAIGFDYVARDVDGSIDTASVSVNVTPVNDDPTSQDAQHTVPEDGSVSGQIDADDADGDALTYSIDEQPENGSVVLNPDGGYTYTPAPDYHGTDSFTVLVDDGNGGTTASTITITVTPEDDPVTAHDDSFSTPEDTPLTLDLLANDVAPDGGLELVSIAGVTLTPGTAQQIAITDDGTSTGTVIGTIDIDASGELVLTPALDYNGTIGFDYVARDVDGSIDTASVSVNVTPVNDAPVAKPDTDDVEAAGVTAGGNADKAGTPTATGNVLDNDTDVDMVLDNTETLEVIGFSLGDDDGTLGSALQGKYGSLVLAADGTYTYTLDNDLEATRALAEGETADEVFHYTIADSEGAQASSTLTITVTGSNDRPLVTSDASAAQGSVTEGGTDNTGGEPDATGTLVASDPDGNATLTWGIVDGDASPAAELDGTYGILRIDPGTGKWTYELDNERSATQELNEGDTETDTFTVRVSDEHGAYSERTITISVSGSNDKLEGIGDKTERFSEDPADGFAGTLQDYVSDADDEIVLVEFTVDGATYSPGDTATISNVGSLSIALDGDYVFTPLEHYSGPVPTITYTVAENRPGGEILTQDLTFEITPVADKPQVEADKTVPTSEDTTVALHLAMPAVVDGTKPNTTEDGDDPERLGAITLQLGGAGAAGATLETTLDGASPLVLAPAADGTITVVITDSSGAHDPSALHIVEPGLVSVHGTPGVYYLTPTEYAAIHAQPGEYAHENFTVTVNVSSYEVDGSGAPLAGIDPAPASQVVTVDVHAVTNQPGLGLLADLDGVDLEDIGAQSLTTTAAAGSDKARIDAAMNEGAALDLSDILLPVFADGDGSEHYWFEISGMPPGTSVKVAGTEYLADPSGTATMPESAALSTDGAAPSFVITLPEYYSNTAPINAVVTLHARDTDGDSTSATPGRESVSVDLNLRVFAQPDDVKLPEPAAAAEDTPIAFLAGLAPLDDDGSESITQIRIADLPSAGGSWTLRDHAGHGIPMPSDGSDLVLAVGADAGAGEYTLEQIKAFTLLPPAHSSLDGEIIVHVTTSEAGVYTDDGQPLEHEWAHSLSLAVLPVAERVNSDNDVTMNGDHQYGAAGREDAWFALGTDTTDATGGGGFAMANAWSNVDAGSGPAIDEFTYAVLTPSLVAQDHQDYSVSGTTFRYHDGSGWSELVYTTDPVWVPAEYLDSLQVRAPENVSGTLQVQMQAGTVDDDDDAEPATRPADPPKVSGPGVDVQLSGSATLSMIELEPVADVVTLALNGHASGREDEAIPLAIRATSSDPSETIDLTIEDIPSGATLYYDGSPVAVSGGTATIENFEPGKGLAIKPPPYSNSDFPLRVFAQSVDGNDRSMATAVREIQVSVAGVANAPEIIAASPQTYTEADLDDPSSTGVSLSDLIASISTPDTDDSETLSARITGLDSAFWLTGASQVSVGNGGDTRVWTVAADDLAGVKIHVPQNYSGAVQIQVAGVSTESDGDSTTGAFTSLGFEVTPSPEASASDSLILAEDERTPLDIHAIPQHGDNDETLGRVFIHIGDVASAASDGKYTLYLDGTPIATAGLTSETIDGESYYVIPAEQVQDLQAQGSAHLDGELGGFRFHYEAIDAGYGSQPAASPVTERFDGGTFSLTATPVSDPVDVSIDSISATTGAATTSDEVSGDKASPDTTTVTTAGTIIEVNLHVESVDHDGSEHLIRVVIDGVPEGVTVVDGAQTGASTWVLVHDGSNALPINDVGGIDLPVRFIISQDVGTAHQEAAITMTVHSQDRGNESEPDTDIVTDSVSWTLITELTGGSGITPPTIVEWAFIDVPATEDAPFQLSGMIDAQVSITDGSVPSIFTVSLTGVPADTVISGMFLTSVGGVPTWTASTTVQGGEDAQQALGALLDGITITAPPDSNSNNNTEEPFTFNAALSASAAGGKPEVADVDLPIEVTPASDKAEISITTSAVEEGSSAGIAVQIDVSNPRDGEHGEIVDGLLYVKLVVTGDNADGVLSLQGGEPLQAQSVSGTADVPDGDYYVIDVGAAGATVDLVYTPAAGQSLEPGSVSFEAYARTQETGAAGMETSRPVTGTAEILIANNGVTVGSTPWEGAEASSADPAQAIPLDGLTVTLNDADSETIDAIMLAGVPVGFLVYVGDDAEHLSLATNAGGDGTSNTWVLSSGGDLPDHVAVLPPAWWSGTLGGLELVVESGETALPTTLVQTFQLEPFVVTPVSSGLTIDPTIAFGAETSIIDLNLNATMADPVTATSSAMDESIETTTLQFVGLGAHAAFYNGGSLIDPATEAVTYDSTTDTYTLVGLGQESLDKLGFMQAASALVDQDMSTGGIQARVIAWTVDGGSAPSEPQEAYLDLQLRPVSGSSGPDSFIWGGAGKAVINGGGGEDTVALRIGEDAGGSALAAGLRNIENIDLGIAGANEVQSLSLEDVLAITDGSNTLAILGDAADSVSLATGWTRGADDGSRTEYSGQVGSQTVTVHIDNLIHVSLL